MKMMRWLFVFILVAVFASCAFAEEAKRTAKIIDVKGDVTVKPQAKDWVMAQIDMLLSQGDIVMTKKDSEALLNVDGTGQTATITVRENSQLLLTSLIMDKEKETQETILDLAVGKILIKAQKIHSDKERFEVTTPTTVVGVRGTTFEVEVRTTE